MRLIPVFIAAACLSGTICAVTVDLFLAHCLWVPGSALLLIDYSRQGKLELAATIYTFFLFAILGTAHLGVVA